MAAKSIWAGDLLYPGAGGEIGKLKSIGWVTRPAKSAVCGGVVKRIDVNMSGCLDTRPCQHSAVVWVEHQGNRNCLTVRANGLDVLIIYRALGSPGWLGTQKGVKPDHFDHYAGDITPEVTAAVMGDLKEKVDRWLSGLTVFSQQRQEPPVAATPKPEPTGGSNTVDDDDDGPLAAMIPSPAAPSLDAAATPSAVVEEAPTPIIYLGKAKAGPLAAIQKNQFKKKAAVSWRDPKYSKPFRTVADRLQ